MTERDGDGHGRVVLSRALRTRAMTQDLEVFRTETRAWLEANCPPSMRTPMTSEAMLWSGTRARFISEEQRLWFERMRDRGWFAPGWPRAWA